MDIIVFILNSLSNFLMFFLDMFVQYNNSCGNLSVGLIGGIITLCTIFFTILPVLLDQEKNHCYLGINISKWLKGYYKDSNKNICIYWVTSLGFITMSILLCLFHLYILSVIVSLLYIIVAGLIIYVLLNSIKNTSYYGEIELYYEKYKNQIGDLYIGPLDFDYDIMTLKYLLKKDNSVLDFKLCDLFEKYNHNKDFEIFSIIIEDIYKQKEPRDYGIDIRYFRDFIINCLMDSNYVSLVDIVRGIFCNELLLYLKNLRADTSNLIGIYNAIDMNNLLNYRNKMRLKHSLLVEINMNAEKSFDIYNDIANYLLKTENEYEVQYVLDLIGYSNDLIDNKTSCMLYISLMVHLHYLIEDESVKYVSSKEKLRYIDIHKRIKDNCNITNMDYDCDITDVFDKIDQKKHIWDIFPFRFGHTVASKNAVMYTTFIKSKKALYLYYLSNDKNHIISEDEEFLFYNEIHDGEFSKEFMNKCKDILSFVGLYDFDIADERYKQYANRIIEASRGNQ